MLPFNAQAANQALGDGGALFSLFSNLSFDDDEEKGRLVGERLEMFDRVRRKRACRMQIVSSVPTEEVYGLREEEEGV